MKLNRRSAIGTATSILALAAAGSLSACSDSDDMMPMQQPGAGGSGGQGGSAGSGGTGGGAPSSTVSFVGRLENVSSSSTVATPFSPGVFAVHAAMTDVFTVGAPALDNGLEALAEDADPAGLAAWFDMPGHSMVSGLFTQPVGSEQAGPILPGDAYEFSFQAEADSDGRLFLASMLGQSNDLFIAPDNSGIALFDASGMPVEGDLTSQLRLWDAGTEANEAPLMGPNQAPRQQMPGQGAREGTIRQFSDSTRALPGANAIADVSVRLVDGAYEITVANRSDQGPIVTPLAPVLWAVHDQSYRLFNEGQPASPELERLAEEGTPMPLLMANQSVMGVFNVGAQATTLERAGEEGPAMPGERFRFMVSPDASYPYLSLASMIGQSNDAFIALRPGGIRLLDDQGQPRDAAAVEDELKRNLLVWDAGTEANEVFGVGMHQAPRQAQPDSGPADPNPMVRPYGDSTNDLEGPGAGGYASVSIAYADDPMTSEVEIELTVENHSGMLAYPGLLTPVAVVLHDGSYMLAPEGAKASPGLESLAEDGDPSGLVAEIEASGGAAAVVLNTPEGASEPGPIASGQRYTMVIAVPADRPYLNLASMVVPSNDTFIGFGQQGIRVLDSAGMPRTQAEIDADLGQLYAWDAGTEANQAGAQGPDQAPRQQGPGAGAAEGPGTVRLYDNAIWMYPDVAQLVRLTITPQK